MTRLFYKGKHILLLASAVLLALALLLSGRVNLSPYELDVFKSGTGWGYNILLNKKIYIHQPFIPAVQNNIPFFSYIDAYITGNKVIQKIENHQNPALSPAEISGITAKNNKTLP